MPRFGLAALAVGLSVASPLSAQAVDAGDRSVLTTTGGARLGLAPTRAVIGLEVSTRARTAAAAAQQTNRGVEALLAALRQHAAVDSARVSSVGVAPNEGEDSRIIDYGARTLIDIFTQQLDQIGVLLDVAFQNGATALGSIRFESDSTIAARDRVVTDAYNAARRDAEALARAAGGQLCRLISMETGRFMSVVAGYAMQGYGDRSFVGVSPTPSEVVIAADVTAKWELCP